MFYGLKIPTHHVVLNKINLKMLQVHAGYERIKRIKRI